MSGRPKSFDISSLMDESVTLFWRQGYQATSVRDVAKAGGLTTGTIYNEFDGKEGLYVASIEHYFNKVIKPRVDSILLAEHPNFLKKGQSDSPMVRLHHFLVSSIHNIPKEVSYQACHLVNTQCEFGEGNSLIQKTTKKATDYISNALLLTLKQAKDLQLISPKKTEMELLSFIYVFFNGLLITAKQTKNST